MKFVKGSPVKGDTGSYWYLHLLGDKARVFVADLLNANATAFMTDPHAKSDYATHLAATASATLATGVLLGERDGYYVNPKGGMTPELYGVTQTINAANFPGTARVKVSVWPRGTHFYARIDNVDVVGARGRYKWNTAAAARQAAKRFARREGIPL